MKKEKLLIVLLVSIIAAAVAIFVYKILSSPQVSIITPPTTESKEQDNLNNLFEQDVNIYPGTETTGPMHEESTRPSDGDTTHQTNPTESTNQNKVVTTQYKFSGLMFPPSDKTFNEHAVIDKYLPRSDLSADWWQNKYFSSPTEENMYEDLGWLFDLEDERVAKWNEFKNKKLKTLLSVSEYYAIFIVESDITPYEQAVAITATDGEMTVEEAINSGEWMYSIRDIGKMEDVCAQLFGIEDVRYASQLISTWGIPSKIYYKKLDDWTYNYAFEYVLTDCSVIIYGNEIPEYMFLENEDDENPRGLLQNLTVYGLGAGAKYAQQQELSGYVEITD